MKGNALAVVSAGFVIEIPSTLTDDDVGGIVVVSIVVGVVDELEVSGIEVVVDVDEVVEEVVLLVSIVVDELGIVVLFGMELDVELVELELSGIEVDELLDVSGIDVEVVDVVVQSGGCEVVGHFVVLELFQEVELEELHDDEASEELVYVIEPSAPTLHDSELVDITEFGGIVVVVEVVLGCVLDVVVFTHGIVVGVFQVVTLALDFPVVKNKTKSRTTANNATVNR